MKKQMESSIKNYVPLVVIISMIAIATIVLAVARLLAGEFSWTVAMANFMAGFFLVFSGFKLLDIKGFAQGYAMYDLLAMRWKPYAYIYPFIELLLGLCYLVHFMPPGITISTLIVMVFSGIGVAIKLAKHEKFHCACLGTVLQVPLTNITLIEDFGMAFMALCMLVYR